MTARHACDVAGDSSNGMVAAREAVHAIERNSGSARSAKIIGGVAIESTLLTTVGLPNRPTCAGSGGFARTMPRLPSRLFEQPKFLAADIGAGAMRNSMSKEKSEPRTCLPSAPAARGGHSASGEDLRSDRIFGAQIDITLVGADGEAANGHAFDQRKRIALHDHAVAKVPESPSSALTTT